MAQERTLAKLVLTEHLKPHLSLRCFHLAGSGGLKAAVREVAANLPDNEFVFRTDVKSYYASINHHILMEIVGRYVNDEYVLALLWRYLRRYVSNGGKFFDVTQGISLGCPLSPLMGALFLKPLDDRMAQLGCFYARFMDDWVILAPTRWKLRKAIKAVNQEMNNLGVVKHPDKTFIGRITQGFDFLGYWFSNSGLAVAKKTIERMLDKVSRLYEQYADSNRVEIYVRRWWCWVITGVVKFLRAGDCFCSFLCATGLFPICATDLRG
ncbi:MAG: reverse transcriptase domain-containing protein [Rivularia sp. (in: cyanobacteria)]